MGSCRGINMRLFKPKRESQTIQTENLTPDLQNPNQNSCFRTVSLIVL